MDFSIELRLARIKKGFRQGALAVAAGISQDRLSKIELGKRRPRQTEIKKFEKLLGIQLSRPKEVARELV